MPNNKPNSKEKKTIKNVVKTECVLKTGCLSDNKVSTASTASKLLTQSKESAQSASSAGSTVLVAHDYKGSSESLVNRSKEGPENGKLGDSNSSSVASIAAKTNKISGTKKIEKSQKIHCEKIESSKSTKRVLSESVHDGWIYHWEEIIVPEYEYTYEYHWVDEKDVGKYNPKDVIVVNNYEGKSIEEVVKGLPKEKLPQVGEYVAADKSKNCGTLESLTSKNDGYTPEKNADDLMNEPGKNIKSDGCKRKETERRTDKTGGPVTKQKSEKAREAKENGPKATNTTTIYKLVDAFKESISGFDLYIMTKSLAAKKTWRKSRKECKTSEKENSTKKSNKISKSIEKEHRPASKTHKNHRSHNKDWKIVGADTEKGSNLMKIKLKFKTFKGNIQPGPMIPKKSKVKSKHSGTKISAQMDSKKVLSPQFKRSKSRVKKSKNKSKKKTRRRSKGQNSSDKKLVKNHKNHKRSH